MCKYLKVFSRSLFLQKVPIIDVSQGPKYISETNHLKAFLYIAAVVNLQALE